MLLHLDYATFNFDKGTRACRDLASLLAGGADLHFTKAGVSDGAPMISPFGLVWRENNGWEARPHRLDVSGVGCSKFASTLPLLRDPEHQHFSRLDFAFDILMPVARWRNFLANAFESSLEYEGRRKKYSLTGSGEAMTVYVGSRRNAKYFRIYNKSLEDKEYEYISDSGEIVPVSDNYYVIRYEVELKRHKLRNHHGEYLFDPSPLFDLYYSRNAEDHEKLVSKIVALWQDFFPSEYLPDMDGLRCAENSNFVQYSDGSLAVAECERKVKEELYFGSQSFDSTVRFVAERFGKYIPWILNNPELRELCFDACYRAYGFDGGVIVEPVPSGWNDLDSADDDEIPSYWEPIESGEQLGFSLYKEYPDI